MVQIEESRQEYMMENGIPPGVPTQKGQNIEPEITGVALPNKPLGNYDVPDGWPTPPHFNEKGDVPGPPIMWEEPEDISNPEAGYGYVSDNEEENDIFFFHTDHLGSTAYMTNKDGETCQFISYMPYGEAIIDEHNTDYENPFKFTGMELDPITGLYDHGARQRDPIYLNWLNPDPLMEKYPGVSPWSYCHANPIRRVDLNGMEDDEITNNIKFTVSIGAQIGVNVDVVGANLNVCSVELFSFEHKEDRKNSTNTIDYIGKDGCKITQEASVSAGLPLVGDVKAEVSQSFRAHDGYVTDHNPNKGNIDADAVKVNINLKCIIGVEFEFNEDFTKDNSFVKLWNNAKEMYNYYYDKLFNK